MWPHSTSRSQSGGAVPETTLLPAVVYRGLEELTYPFHDATYTVTQVPTLLRDAPIYDSLGEHTDHGAKGAPQ